MRYSHRGGVRRFHVIGANIVLVATRDVVSFVLMTSDSFPTESSYVSFWSAQCVLAQRGAVRLLFSTVWTVREFSRQASFSFPCCRDSSSCARDCMFLTRDTASIMAQENLVSILSRRFLEFPARWETLRIEDSDTISESQNVQPRGQLCPLRTAMSCHVNICHQSTDLGCSTALSRALTKPTEHLQSGRIIVATRRSWLQALPKDLLVASPHSVPSRMVITAMPPTRRTTIPQDTTAPTSHHEPMLPEVPE